MEIDDDKDKNNENNSEDVNPNRTDVASKRQMNNNENVGDEKSTDDEANKRKKTNEMVNNEGNSSLAENNAETGTASLSERGEGFQKIRSKVKRRNYRRHSRAAEENLSSDEEETREVRQEVRQEDNVARRRLEANSDSEPSPLWVAQDESVADRTRSHTRSVLCPLFRDVSSSSSSTSDMPEEKVEESESEGEDSEMPKVLGKQKPRHKWFITPEVLNRQLGVPARKQGPELFTQRMYGSLHVVQRLELMYKLDHHTGCVNCVNFNQKGNLIASGSDDLKICLWDWAGGKLLTSFDTGHKSNVFQAMFLPLAGDTHLVTCARDGQIRLMEMGSDGALRSSRKLGQHRGPSHKLDYYKDTPHVFLTCGEDALVMSFDVRQPKPEKVLFVKDDARKIPLYYVDCCPMTEHRFLVCGKDNFIRIYDRRDTSSPLKKLSPLHLMKKNSKDPVAHVTSAVFNHNGTEVLGSYNDEDIYLFDVNHSEGDYIHKYQGHRNNATVKGVNFFGPRSEFVVSGSDCGNIFFWDRETEAVVQWMPGDENGVVNRLEPHPQIPVIATCGLDEDVKIWVPSCEQEPTLEGLKTTVATNMKGRDGDRTGGYDSIDGQMLWIMWRHIRRTERINAQNQSNNNRNPGVTPRRTSPLSTSLSSSSTSEDEETDGQGRRLQCSPS